MSWEPPIPVVVAEDTLSQEELEERLNWLELVWEDGKEEDPKHV